MKEIPLYATDELDPISYSSSHGWGGCRDSLCPSINRPRQTPSLPLQMKLHIHLQQMLKRFPRHFPDSSLRDTGEKGTSQLAKYRRQDSRNPIYPSIRSDSKAVHFGTYLHPTTLTPAKTQTVLPAVISTFIASTISLK